MSDVPSSSTSYSGDVDGAALLRKFEQALQRLDQIEAKVLAGAQQARLNEALNSGQSTKPPVTDWYKRILETLQVIVIIAGFGFTVLQVGRLQESTDLTAWNSVSTEWLKVDQFFVQHPELRKYFYDGVAIDPKDPNYEEVEGVANYVLNFLDYAISTSDHVVSKYPDAASLIQPSVWQAYVRLTYFRSPAVCALLRKLNTGYNKETRRIGKETCPPV